MPTTLATAIIHRPLPRALSAEASRVAAAAAGKSKDSVQSIEAADLRLFTLFVISDS